jgi:hypothetical protein
LFWVSCVHPARVSMTATLSIRVFIIIPFLIDSKYETAFYLRKFVLREQEKSSKVLKLTI